MNTPAATSETPANSDGGHGLGPTLAIVAAIVLAVLVALIFPHFAASLKIGGDIFLGLLKMLVVPLVVVSVMSGVLGLGDVRKIGRPGGMAVLYYLTTTILAVVVGLVVVNIIQPGKAVNQAELEAAANQSDEAIEARQKAAARKAADEALTDAIQAKEDARLKFNQAKTALEEDATDEQLQAAMEQADAELKAADVALTKAEKQKKDAGEEPSLGQILENLVRMLFTDNLFRSAMAMDLLPLILFSLFFAGLLTTLGPRVDAITTLVEQFNTALMQFVLLLMKIAPIGIFCLVAAQFGEAQAADRLGTVIRQTQSYMITVLVGLAVHAFVTLPLILWLVTRRNPYKFMLKMAKPLLTAFSTASSSATLPITLETVIEEADVSRESAEFVLPLGATVNMDGTALYEAAAAIFIAQAMGAAFDLTLTKQIVIAVTATLAAIGAAGIPQAGLFTMIIVFNAVGLPVEYVGYILSVDWLLDRFRTAVNVLGDSIGAAVVDGSFRKAMNEPVS